MEDKLWKVKMGREYQRRSTERKAVRRQFEAGMSDEVKSKVLRIWQWK
jgi:hypothetical protein